MDDRHGASIVNATMEIPMNRPFQPTSPLRRCMFAVAAVVTMIATAGGIEALITHYSTAAPLASSQFGRVAQR